MLHGKGKKSSEEIREDPFKAVIGLEGWFRRRLRFVVDATLEQTTIGSPDLEAARLRSPINMKGALRTQALMGQGRYDTVGQGK